MHVAELWRYPVKSLRGEALEETQVAPDGLSGDRLVHVRDGRDRLVTPRTKPGVLGLRASLAPDGGAEVEGAPWDSPEAGRALARVAGVDARFVHAPERDRFDDTSILLVTDGAVAALGVDGRRLRPNLVVAGVDGLAERAWPGRTVRAGDVELAVEKVCKRCLVTTFDPDTLEQDAGVLARIQAEYGGRFALNCWVTRPGRVRVGDAVELV